MLRPRVMPLLNFFFATSLIVLVSCQSPQPEPHQKGENDTPYKIIGQDLGRFQLQVGKVTIGTKSGSITDDAVFRIDTKTGAVWRYFEYFDGKITSRRWILTEDYLLYDQKEVLHMQENPPNK
jgi:hypothetical protein